MLQVKKTQMHRLKVKKQLYDSIVYPNEWHHNGATIATTWLIGRITITVYKLVALGVTFRICCILLKGPKYFHALTSPHDDVIKWKHSPRYWPFVRGIHRSPVNSPHKDQWRGASMFPLICAWINGCVYNGGAGNLRRHRTHYNVTAMMLFQVPALTARSWLSGVIWWAVRGWSVHWGVWSSASRQTAVGPGQDSRSYIGQNRNMQVSFSKICHRGLLPRWLIWL